MDGQPCGSGSESDSGSGSCKSSIPPSSLPVSEFGSVLLLRSIIFGFAQANSTRHKPSNSINRRAPVPKPVQRQGPESLAGPGVARPRSKGAWRGVLALMLLVLLRCCSVVVVVSQVSVLSKEPARSDVGCMMLGGASPAVSSVRLGNAELWLLDERSAGLKMSKIDQWRPRD